MRRQLKRYVGQLIRVAVPHAEYRRSILMLSHMRSASTALANVICSHPQVSGYGETHIRHDASNATGRLVLNMARRKAWSPRSSYLFDKVLHNDLDQTPPPDFSKAYGLFLLRPPGEAIGSIQNLARVRDLPEWKAETDAAEYYAERVERLARLWTLFPPERRLGLFSETVWTDPDAVIARINDWLDLTPSLSNRYDSHPASTRGGGGDPLYSGTQLRIEKRGTPRGKPSPLEVVPDGLLDRCTSAHQRLADLISGPA